MSVISQITFHFLITFVVIVLWSLGIFITCRIRAYLIYVGMFEYDKRMKDDDLSVMLLWPAYFLGYMCSIVLVGLFKFILIPMWCFVAGKIPEPLRCQTDVSIYEKAVIAREKRLNGIPSIESERPSLPIPHISIYPHNEEKESSCTP